MPGWMYWLLSDCGDQLCDELFLVWGGLHLWVWSDDKCRQLWCLLMAVCVVFDKFHRVSEVSDWVLLEFRGKGLKQPLSNHRSVLFLQHLKLRHVYFGWKLYSMRARLLCQVPHTFKITNLFPLPDELRPLFQLKHNLKHAKHPLPNLRPRVHIFAQQQPNMRLLQQYKLRIVLVKCRELLCCMQYRLSIGLSQWWNFDHVDVRLV